MARHQEFNNTDTVACVEDTTRSAQGNGEDTTQSAHGNGEDTTRSAQGNGEDTTRSAHGNGEDTTRSAHGNGEDTTRSAQGNGEDTTRSAQGNGEDTTPEMQGNERKGSLAVLPEGLIEKSDGLFRCIVCNKNLGCSSISAAILHVQRKKHCKALARRQEFHTDMVDCVEDATQGNIEDTTRATHGNDLTDGPNKYETEELPEGFIQKPDGQFQCIVCNKKYRFSSITTISDAIQHVHGKKHRAALARGRQQYNTYMLECTEDATQATRGNDVAVPPGFTLETDTQFRCIVCDVVCNSKASVGSHVRDKKHREQKLLMALRDRE